MSCFTPHPKLSTAGAKTARVGTPLPGAIAPSAGFVGWLTRPRRIFMTLLVVGVLHMFDLRFTMIEHSKGHFYELNPLAAACLGHSLFAVVCYKLGLLGAGALIIWRLRRHAIAERASYLLLAACLYLGVRWQQYFELAPDNPALFLSAVHSP